MLVGDALGVCEAAVPAWIAAVLTLAATVLFMRRAAAALAIAVALMAIAAAASLAAQRAMSPQLWAPVLRSFTDGAIVTAEGRIDHAPERFADRTYVFVAVERAGGAGAGLRRAGGAIRITAVGLREAIHVGDEVRLSGALRFPRNFGDPGEFDYVGYVARQGIAATMVLRGPAPLEVTAHHPEFPATQIAAIRERIGALIDANLTGDERAEMRALVIGDRRGIDEALRQRFALTGLAHMLVISGLHLGFVAAAAFALTRLMMMFFPGLAARGWANKTAAIAAAIAVTAYAMIAGGRVSTIRALVMVLAYTLAMLLDRSREIVASLALAAIVICLAIPGSTADVGFQLSFVSVLAIVLGMRRFGAWWRRRIDPRRDAQQTATRTVRICAIVAGYVAVSFWALLGVAPLTAYHFNQFSAVGVFANAVVVPVMALGGVVCGLVGCALGLIAPMLGAPFLHVAGWALGAGTSLAGWFMRWPAAYFKTFTPTPLEVTIAYGLLLLWLSAPIEPDALTPAASAPAPSGAAEPGRHALRVRAACWAILLVGLAADAGWWTYDRWFNPDLRITFLSVGEGDSAVVRFGGGPVMLIDAGGAYPGGYDFGERIVARYLWAEKIMRVDYLVVSHPDADHFGGMAYVLRNFSPGEFWTTGASSPDASYAALLAQVAAQKVPVRIVNSSTTPTVVGGASIQCLSPMPEDTAERDNNLSMVLRISAGTRRTFCSRAIWRRRASGHCLRARPRSLRPC